jgi:hypothetical protein
MMNSATRILELFMIRVANELISAPPLSGYLSEKEMADLLFDALKSVLLGDSYSVEQELTLYYDNVQGEDEKFEDEGDNAEIDSDFDSYVETAGSISQAENLSLEYMTRALECYDERDELGNRKHPFRSVKNRFKKIHHQSTMARFRKYIREDRRIYAYQVYARTRPIATCP